jgi:hypothetical protein
MLLFWVVTLCRLIGRYQCFRETHAVSTFRAEVAMLGSGDIYTGPEEGQGRGNGLISQE